MTETVERLHDQLGELKRRMKSVTQCIRLCEIRIHSASCISLKICGSTNKSYEITISNYTIMPKFKCTCPDNIYKERTCKHIYWLCTKKFKKEEPDDVNSYDIDYFIFDYINRYGNNSTSFNGGINQKSRNELCPICFEDVTDIIQSNMVCCQYCMNSIHGVCWKRYYFSTYSDKCVICRLHTMPTITFTD